MQNKTILGLGMMIAIVLTTVLVFATVNSVTLTYPDAGNWTNKTNTQLLFNFSYVGDTATATCNLMMSIDGEPFAQKGTTSANNNTPTVVTSSSPLTSGRHQWYVECDGMQSETRGINIDYVIPTTADDAPSGWQSADTTVHLTSDDDGFSTIKIYSCQYPSTQSTCTPSEQSTQIVTAEGNNTIRYYSADIAGNREATKTTTVALDKTKPAINLVQPANDTILLDQNTVNFTFTAADKYSTTMNCTLKIDGQNNETNGSVANATSTMFSNIRLNDAVHTWAVSCVDFAGNTNASLSNKLTVNATPDKAVVLTSSSLVNSDWINIYGYVNRAGATTNVTVYAQQRPDQTINFSTTVTDHANITGTAVVNQSEQANTSFFYIQPAANFELPAGFSVGNYVDFSHNEPYMQYYTIIAAEYQPSQVWRINITPALSSGITQGETVTAYNQSKPTGWFNISINLFEGNNTIWVQSRRFGLTSPLSNSYYVFKDTTPPAANLSGITAYNTTTPTINFTVTDNYQVNTSTIIVNITNGTGILGFNSSQVNCVSLPVCKVTTGLANGYHNITVTVSDLSGYTNISTAQFLIDTKSPAITLLSPDNLLEETTRDVTFNFTATDDYSSNLNCTIRVQNQNTSAWLNITDIILANNTVNQSSLTNLSDASYVWTVYCYDESINYNISNLKSFSVENTPKLAVLDSFETITADNSLNIVGYAGKPQTTINITLRHGESIPRTTQVTSNEHAYKHNYSDSFRVAKENVQNGSYLFYINKTYNNFFNDSSKYVKFAGHERAGLLNYHVLNVTAIDNQYYSQVFLEEPLEHAISLSEIIYVYNQSKPSGWFNTTLTNLFEGENNISIIGERMGLVGPAKSMTIFYDNEAPVINTSLIPSNLTTNVVTFNFTTTDNYNITTETLLVTVTNGTNTTNHVWSGGTAYNTSSWSLGSSVTCTGTRYQKSCYFAPTLQNGVYNVTITVNDTINNKATGEKTGIVIAADVLAPTRVTDTGATTESSTTLNVSWTNVSEQQYFSHYELSAGNATYPNEGWNNATTWFAVGKNTSYSLTNLTLRHGEMYYTHVRAVNLYGAISGVVSSDGIAVEDNSVPAYIPGSALWNGTDSGDLWTNDASLLRGTWNFEDNETGISKFMFAIGTVPYPLSGWDSIMASKETTAYGFEESGLALEQNKSYYFSVKAKNGYKYGFGWSDWYSSSYIKQDLTSPTGGSMSYSSGNYTAGSITLTYHTGDDYLSGYNYGQLLMKKTNYDPINGGCNAYSDYTVINQSVTKTGTPVQYYYQGLEDGKCYKFALRIYDKAGNYATYVLGTENYNVTSDSTAPSMVTVTDDGTITGSRTLHFSWAQAVDPHTGIDHYEYALGTAQGGEQIINFTSTILTRSITLSNMPLQDEQMYYLTVKAYNRVGLVSTSYSDGVLYLDMDTPAALNVTKIANDTNSSDNYYDYDADQNTTVYLSGENSLTCAWSHYDIDYTQPSLLTNYSWACANTANDPVARKGNYTCEISTPSEGIYSIYVNCKDDAGNRQLSAENTDIQFYKENSGPQINITYPENGSVVNGQLRVNISVWDLSSHNLTYQLRKTPENTLVLNQTVADKNNIVINTASLEGEYQLTFFGVDAYNHTSNSSVNFVVNNNAPTIILSLPATYYKENFNFTITSTLFINLAYNITNASGAVKQNATWNHSELQVLNTTIVSVNVSSLPEGNYTIRAAVFDNRSTNRTVNRTFAVDRTPPQYRGPFEVTPNTTIYENETVTVYLNWKEAASLDRIWVMHDANGSNANYTATATTPGSQIYEGYTRYKVNIPVYMTRANQTITYSWFGRDMAGNENSTASNTIHIENRLPNITTANLSDAKYNINYEQLVYFEDLDSHNSSSFNCSVEGLPITPSIIGTTVCSLTWASPTPVGTNEVNISVTDGINTTTKRFNLTVLPTTLHNISINTSHTIGLEYWINGTLERKMTANDDLNLTLLSSASYTAIYRVDSLEVSTDHFNVTSNIDLFFQMINNNTIDDNDTLLGSGRKYRPLEAYAFSLNTTQVHNNSYRVAFNYTKYGMNTDGLKIFKFGYAGGQINYSDSQTVTTTVDSGRQQVYIDVYNFSLFVLAYDTGVQPENTPSGSGGSGGGGGHHGGGSYSYSYVPPATCSDNISNQGEAGIDCGGPCAACQTCHDNIKNQGEAGIDCGGPCSADCPTCTDGKQNDGETGIDCGGPCASCEPIVTCSDGILNGLEQGIDCGGPCIPCPGCSNGIRDYGEEGVDCGGVCEAECGPEVIELPVEVKKTPAYVWLIIVFILLIGGGTATWIYTREEKIVKQKAEEVVAEEEEVGELKDEERSVMSIYITKYLSQGLKEENIKSQLLMDGFKQHKVDAVMAAVIQDKKIQELQNYIMTYASQGYEVDYLKEWILNHGVDENLLKEAEERFRQQMADKDGLQK